MYGNEWIPKSARPPRCKETARILRSYRLREMGEALTRRSDPRLRDNVVDSLLTQFWKYSRRAERARRICLFDTVV